MRFGYSALSGTMDYWVSNPPLLNRFNNDNLCLDLLQHAESMPLDLYFTVDYATSFNSIKPTQLLLDTQEVANFMEPSKHNLFILSDSLLTDLRSMYAK